MLIEGALASICWMEDSYIRAIWEAYGSSRTRSACTIGRAVSAGWPLRRLTIVCSEDELLRSLSELTRSGEELWHLAQEDFKSTGPTHETVTTRD